ncbi:hypothetical protein ACHAWF_006969 [Thalassiosira exigua]
MSVSGGRRRRERAALFLSCLCLVAFQAATAPRDLLSIGRDAAAAVGENRRDERSVRDAPPSGAPGGEGEGEGGGGGKSEEVFLLAPAPGDFATYADFAGNRTERRPRVAIGGGEACLVHVGKTAGSAIRCVLDLHVPTCPKGGKKARGYEAARNATELGRLFAAVPRGRGIVHMGSRSCASHPGLVIATSRNPIDRIRSDFHYSRCREDAAGCLEEKRLLYRDCFYEFRDLASRGLRDFYAAANDASSSSVPGATTIPPDPGDMDCARRAWAYVAGDRQFYPTNHNWYNYEYYFDVLASAMGCWGADARTLADPSVEPLDLARRISSRLVGGSNASDAGERARCPGIVVLRNEFLGRDWDRVQTMLGGYVAGEGGDELFGKARINQGRERRKGDGTWFAAPTPPSDDDDFSLLCRAMCRELQYYKLLLWLSANVDAEDAEDSMRDLRRTCPREPSVVRRCDTALDPQPVVGQHAHRKGQVGIGVGKPRLTG